MKWRRFIFHGFSPSDNAQGKLLGPHTEIDALSMLALVHPSSLILHPSSFIPHPSSLILHPSSFIPHPSSFIPSFCGRRSSSSFASSKSERFKRRCTVLAETPSTSAAST